ncbi:hypothetical protein NP493_1290g01014 [Ridgeia piscesae]|uniref:Fibronectin type III domain-containing protein n=1 Tax=Ridgeia piscesae TaxID=27915 RepID=A0AAD9NG36_RIDPI|nr:hypothetical protein NP493_1290g01014 [Ridgeia piscesae]
MLDNVQVQEVNDGQRSSSADRNNSPMHLHVTTWGSYTAVTAAWDVEDPESPVTGHSWAIGTVRGGVQLHNFRSVGMQTYARADALLMQQGAEVHVTVVTKNAAGLTTAIYSDPLTIDLTPPVLCCLAVSFWDGVSEVATSRTLTISWSVRDPESGVSHCEWAAGKSPGSQEVQPFTRTTSLSTASVALDASVSHGETVFSVVRCFNYAGLQSTLVSSGVVMVTAPPDTSMATLNVITNSPSQYPSRDHHQADSRRLMFGWEGIRDGAGIKGYEVSVQQTRAATVVPWRVLASTRQLYATLHGLGLQAYSTYTLLLRVTNSADLTSDVIVTNFTIETEAPRVTSASLRSRWPVQSTLTLDWTDVFASNSSLVYEVNIGTTQGAIDVLSWLDTERTVLQVARVDHTKEHYVTLTAINKAGLYTTRSFVVAYSTVAGFE